MTYSYDKRRVNDFILILKHFFVPDIIERRNPLSSDARRAGWEGCNILIDKVPEQGRIPIVSWIPVTHNHDFLHSFSMMMLSVVLLLNRDRFAPAF
jgi:hypothetical protein